MLFNSDSTIVDPYFSRLSKSRFSYRAGRPFVCRFVRLGLCVTIRISVICLSIRMSVSSIFEKGAVSNDFRIQGVI